MNPQDYKRLRTRARQVLLERCGAAQEADIDDLVQASFLRFLERGLEVDPQKGTLGSLLCGVMDKLGWELSRARRRGATEPLPPGLIDGGEVPGEAAMRDEASGLVGRWFRELTDREREALIRIYGPLFGCWAGGEVEPRDYVAAHRARAKLRRRARGAGLIEE
jgi:DNA-directed RNA polymerase specialized sigma24 family protein